MPGCHIDPELTHYLERGRKPPAVTASTGMDALTQVLEPFVSHSTASTGMDALASARTRSPSHDGMCAEGLRRAGRSLRIVYAEPENAEARWEMALTSLLGGLALANAKLGAVHGFAGVLGGMYDAPHGAICAALLPPVMEANIKALHAREPENPALKRYEYAAQFLLFDRSGKGAGRDGLDRRDQPNLRYSGLGRIRRARG